ncbi:exocyst complex subunit Sec15-like-domain-containing protein [Thamnocephalis sphaerospora]|uniref:Exocyst complex subunit Sec15-like-domain-containing protein n=1 Tax=Thamnocephalis sphaerospora TaxID=78915 RepID=A0A4P9XUS2_9FUNG|nr:exocyst complex subunit Sec15-like-domain-containing protein [Thamnocephalis sphaerospora]|eukprot:RKP09983.1 exocyst complex subunit Sec15-like-domain-containing protein [Thamnocephalis sphaerospora]
MEQARELQKRMAHGTRIDTTLELVLDEENSSDLLEDERVKIDCRPLYQCIHIHDKLGRRNEFKKHYEEDRQAQIDLILKTKISLTPEGQKTFTNMLQEVLGFFIVEHRVAHTTQEFRSKARVEVLWTMVAERITRAISDAVRRCSDLDALSHVKETVTLFIPALERYTFDTRKPQELSQALIERCAALTLLQCTAQFKKHVEEDGFKPMQVKDEKEYRIMRGLYRFPEDSDAKQKGFPRMVPFSSVVPLTCADLKRSIDQFYAFAVTETGHPVIPQVDMIARESVDMLLGTTVPGVLSERLKTNSMAQVVQINVNVEHFGNVCTEFETFLAERQVVAPPDHKPIKLKACESFVTARKHAEKRIFELINGKIDEFLRATEYDWMPKRPRTQPAGYLTELTAYLKEIFTTAITNLPAGITSFVRINAMDHVATTMNKMLLGPQVKKFNLHFVATIDVDVSFLERFVEDMGDPMLLEVFVELRQVITLLMSDNRNEYLDVQMRNRKYSRLKPALVMSLFEKLR